MPQPLARPCKHVGCPGLARERGVRYCQLHASDQEAEDRKRRERFNAERPSPRQRGYTATWERIRRAYLAAHPLCEVCLMLGRSEPAVLVHHRDEDPTNNDRDNLMALSRDCHERLHGRAR